jgi:hypothetical protein
MDTTYLPLRVIVGISVTYFSHPYNKKTKMEKIRYFILRIYRLFFNITKVFIYMNFDIKNLINIFKKLNSSEGDRKTEFDEQEAAAPTTASSGGGGKAVPKWADTVGGPKRGKANMLGKGGEKWETGMNRGVANQIY